MPSRQLERGSSKRTEKNPDDADEDDMYGVCYHVYTIWTLLEILIDIRLEHMLH